MASQRDPYHEWLGIPPKDQPPNHYRLLGIEPLEADPSVIVHAVNRQLGHLRTFVDGPRGDEAKQLIGKISEARSCLLDAGKKAKYDAALIAGGRRSSAGHSARTAQRLIVGATAAACGLLVVAVVAAVWPAGEPQKDTPVEPPAVAAVPVEVTPPQSVPAAQQPAEELEPAEPDKPEAKPALQESFPEKQSEGPLAPEMTEIPQEVVVKPVAAPPPVSVPTRPTKLRVPDGEPLDRARKTALDVFQEDLKRAGNDRTAQSVVAKKILQQAKEFRNDSTARYALLCGARDLAAQCYDHATAFAAVEEIAEGFQINPWEMKASLLEGWAKKQHLPTESYQYAMQAISLMNAANRHGEFTVSDRMAKLAKLEGGKAKEKELVNRAKAGLLEAEQARRAAAKFEAAFAALKVNADDPDANLTVGCHFCFSEGLWEKGCEHLAKGADAALKAAAELELAALQANRSLPVALAPDLGNRAVRLGDVWWGLAEKSQGAVKEAMSGRAGHWYKKAMPDVESELLRVKLTKRLADIAKTVRPDAASTAASASVSVNSIGMKLVFVPAGEFVMGSPEAKGREDETPRHHVRISKPFYIGQCEVTVGQYRKFVEATRHEAGSEWRAHWKNQTDEWPVTYVNWNDAAAFCAWLSRKEGKLYRLPTEAEWEYASRAGVSGKYCFGDGDSEFGANAWYDRNADKSPHPVAQKKPNAWGLYDVHGNVWEWCADWYDAHYYAQSPPTDPLGAASGSVRTLRGGSWGDGPSDCRAANRLHGTLNSRTNRRGFRIARNP